MKRMLGLGFGLLLLMAGCATSDEEASTPEMKAVEKALPELATRIEQARPDRQTTEQWLKQHLNQNPGIFGAAFAPPSPADGGVKYPVALYIARGPDGLQSRELRTPSYDYPKVAWYRAPVESKRPMWTEPYYDRGAGNVWMRTYSIPLYMPDGRLYGVVTSDIRSLPPTPGLTLN